LIGKSGLSILSLLMISTASLARVPARGAVETESEHYRLYIDMIRSAIADEMVVGTSVDAAREFGPEVHGQVTLNLDVLIAPFNPGGSAFSTHVIYVVPGYGYVIRQVSVYPKENLALFWLGYSAHGPGADTGFNCTHSRSNCKIEDIPFSDVRSAFHSWWSAKVKVEIGNAAVAKDAAQRNAKRAKLIDRDSN
jgi:hypothetical protein